MRIRSVYFNDFRNFRGEHTIDLCSELTGEPNLVTVLAGSNGSGKTTIFETIEALISYASGMNGLSGLAHQVHMEKGCVAAQIFTGAIDLREESALKDQVTTIAVGHRSRVPIQYEKRWPNLAAHFNSGMEYGGLLAGTEPQSALLANHLVGGHHPGVLYFPSDRRITSMSEGRIEESGWTPGFVQRVFEPEEWQGSLEQHWVWLNYLDLESGEKRGTRLKPFLSSLSDVLGPDRTLYVKEGRVLVTPGKRGGLDVRIEHLPSGEKQVLMIVGEMVRRARPGVVVMIDEPELSLHPGLQIALTGYLEDFAREWDAQIILATHSYEIVSAWPASTKFLDVEMRQRTMIAVPPSRLAA